MLGEGGRRRKMGLKINILHVFWLEFYRFNNFNYIILIIMII